MKIVIKVDGKELDDELLHETEVVSARLPDVLVCWAREAIENELNGDRTMTEFITSAVVYWLLTNELIGFEGYDEESDTMTISV